MKLPQPCEKIIFKIKRSYKITKLLTGSPFWPLSPLGPCKRSLMWMNTCQCALTKMNRIFPLFIYRHQQSKIQKGTKKRRRRKQDWKQNWSIQHFWSFHYYYFEIEIYKYHASGIAYNSGIEKGILWTFC